MSISVAREEAGGWLSKSHTVAKPGFNRWSVPPAALAIHLCIGMSYGLSVFWLPLSKAIAGDAPAECKSMGVLDALFTTSCNWRVSDLLVTFTIGIVFLGISAALFGGWLERAGPRKAGLVAAACWGGGFLGAALGVYVHQLWIIWLSLGVLGGVGLGLGYISPVSTLVKWFPDRRGMATGMAIMGFGGGAMIGSPLANMLMNHFKDAHAVGAWQTMATLGVLYFLFMSAGAMAYRVSPEGWRPEGWTPPANVSKGMITQDAVALENAHKTPQFWLIWAVLCLNVSAGIGVLAMASPMLQEIFGGALVGPFVIGYIRDAQIAAGVERAQVYDRTLYILAGFLVLGFVCNAAVRPVAPKWLMRREAYAGLASTARAESVTSSGIGVTGSLGVGTIVGWLCVGLPIAWGVWQTLQSAIKIFQ